MQLPTFKALASAALLFPLAAQFVGANETNPYGTIVDRNPFALKPPPPPPAAPEQTAPPVPMAKVILTGLLSTFGEPRALFEIVEEPGKGGGTPKKPILREGERLGAVEVLAIDVVKNSVRIRNSGVETNVTFEVAKAGPAAGGPGVPGVAPALTPPPSYAPPALNTTQAQPLSSGGPTIISPNSASVGGGGVSLFGGDAGSPINTASAPGTMGALGAPSGAMPSIPPRPLRASPETPTSQLPPMTRDQAALLIEARRLEGKVPPMLFPPTHLTPEIEGELGGQPQGGPPAFPQFPQKRR